MVCENDEFKIPEKYLKMSADELKRLEEKKYKEILADREKGIGLPKEKPKTKLVVNW